jgi:hypothetical protein
MDYTAREIYKAFGGKLHVHKLLRDHVCRTVAQLPKELIDHITKHCWFLGSTEDAWAYTFRGDEIAGKHLIILTDLLLNQPDEDIEWTIMHEIGHVVLGHRNGILEPQTKAETTIQEQQADAFAKKYLY